MNRKFTPYEINQLNKYGLSDVDPDTVGEKPVEYITGHSIFKNLDFLVTPSVLIPRIETEKLVDLSLDLITEKEMTHPVIADIATGSGCVGIAVAKKLQLENHPFTIFLSDISDQAINVARGNAQRILSYQTNVYFETSDLLNNFPSIKFDIITANLPYIPSSNINKLPDSVKNYEPITALDGGEYGSSFINRLITQLPNFLNKNGVCFLEIDDTQTASSFQFLENMIISTINDCFNRPRFLSVKLG